MGSRRVLAAGRTGRRTDDRTKTSKQDREAVVVEQQGRRKKPEAGVEISVDDYKGARRGIGRRVVDGLAVSWFTLPAREGGRTAGGKPYRAFVKEGYEG